MGLRLRAEPTRAGPGVSPAELDANHAVETHRTVDGDLDGGTGLLSIEQLAVEEDEPLAEVDVCRWQPDLDDLGEAQPTPARLRLGEDPAHIAAIGHAASPEALILETARNSSLLYLQTFTLLTPLHLPVGVGRTGAPFDKKGAVSSAGRPAGWSPSDCHRPPAFRMSTIVLLTPGEIDAATKKSVDYRPPGARDVWVASERADKARGADGRRLGSSLSKRAEPWSTSARIVSIAVQRRR